MKFENPILVIDDDVEVRSVLMNWCGHLGMDCVPVGSGEEALAKLATDRFDIVLTDIVMAGIEGLELTKRIKREWPDLPVIIMTGFAERFSYYEAIDAGAADFLKKPFTMEELGARIKIVKMHQELKGLAITDELTGIYNRRGFLTLADHLLKLARRNRLGQYLLYADLDNMKWINDTFGHNEGDSALRKLALALKGNYRDSDIVARMGGDEFVVFPVGTAGDSIQEITDRLEDLMKKIGGNGKMKYDLTISYGLSYYDPEEPCSLAELISKADGEMYKAKKTKKEP